MTSSPDESPERATGPAGQGTSPRSRRRGDDREAKASPSGPAWSPSPTPTVADDAAHVAASVPPDLRTTETSEGFGELLGPVLEGVCDGRLRDIRWFRTDWQRSGALTGYATYANGDGQPHPAVVKLPVPPCERHWLVHLHETGDAGGVVPRVYAHDERLGGYDLAWVVMERLPHGPLGPQWRGREFDLLVEAAGRFYAAAQSVPRRGEPVNKDWEALLDESREHASSRALPEAQRWKAALKKAHKKVKAWAAVWRDRDTDGWVHGDLHLGNAMTRGEPPDGPAVLFDFAKTRVGHWLEDAVYFEHLFWCRSHRLDGRKLCSAIAHERKKHGLTVEAEWPRLADTKRALLAMCTPADLVHDGDPHHVHACLQVLERAVG